MKHPDLKEIKKLLEKNQDFSLTAAQYKRQTGADIPKGKSYTEKRSAVAKEAEKYGFQVEVVPEIIKFKKIQDNK